ncbi:hypothetical protein [Tsuneonella sp. HG222]
MDLDPVVLTYAFALISIATALLFGGAPERIGGLVVLSMAVLQTLMHIVHPQFYHDVDPVSVVIDVFLFVNLLALAIYAERLWPVWGASLQILSLSAHFARALHFEMPEMVYGLMKAIPTLFFQLALIVGTINHRRIVKRLGSDVAWKEWRAPKAR